MRLTIKNREFWMPNEGGYIRLESPGAEGVLGQQICEGGGLDDGATIRSTPAKFEEDCLRWLASRGVS